MSAYLVPDLPRTAVTARAASEPSPADCPQCQAGTPVRHWPLAICRSSFRRDDAGTERLVRVHCTCDWCF